MRAMSPPLVLPLLLLLCTCGAAAEDNRRQPRLALRSKKDAELTRLRSGSTVPSTTLTAARLGAAQTAPVVQQESSRAGVLGLLGGVMIHLACGSMYTWGNLLSYMPPHLKYWSGDASGKGLPDAQLVLPFILVSQMTGMPLGPMLEKFMGPRLTALLGALMMGCGVTLAASAKTLKHFVLLWSVMFGLGVGIAYQQPFITGARWFPKKKGMVTGAIISGLGVSAFLFNILSTKLINPKNLEAVNDAFPPEIYASWPSLLRTLGLIYGTLAVVGALLQSNPNSHDAKYPLLDYFSRSRAPHTSAARGTSPSTPKASVTSAAQPSVTSLVFSRQFAIYWLMILNSAVSGLNIIGSYKTFGAKQPHLNSDAFLSLVGSLASILGNAAGRFAWGAFADIFGFKTPFMILTVIQAVTMMFFKQLAATRATFTMATVVMLFCMGGNFAMFPAQVKSSAPRVRLTSLK
uniref:Major facilitator superfamily (MFS) profile domain-containing protein n=1 Tax=Chrysotila carterae TaxID=13221 RepID=A0A7S4F4J8_CHRCT